MGLIDGQKLRHSWEERSRQTHGVTLAALYGDDKPGEFLNLVREALSLLRSKAGEWIREYSLKSIHATLVGLEGERNEDGKILNSNFVGRVTDSSSRSNVPEMDFEGLLDFFGSRQWPLDIQIGGFHPGDTNPCDVTQPPFERSFDIRDNGLVVMIGWPVSSDGTPFAPTLVGIRKDIERLNVTHKYHVEPHQRDNDLFCALGSVNFDKWDQAKDKEQRWFEGELDEAKTEIRAFLADNRTLIRIGLEHLWVIEYFRSTLERAGFCKQLAKATPQELRKLYR
jgi:hypothetical protein